MILSPLLLSALTSVILLFSSRRTAIVFGLSMLGSAVILVSSFLLCYQVFTEGSQSLVMGGWPRFIGISFRVDRLSAMMVFISSLIAFCGQFALLAIKRTAKNTKALHSLYHFMMVGVYGSFLTADLFNLYVWFEVLLLASFFLVAFLQKKSSLFASFKYSILNIISSLVFLLGIALVYASTGSLDFQVIAKGVRTAESALSLHAGLGLLFVAFSIKAGLFPFHFWLPASYPATLTAVAAVFSGLLTKVGLYAILRLIFPLAVTGAQIFLQALYAIALLSMLLGVMGALAQNNIKSILSFHIISQVGYIALCLSLGSKVGLAAAIFYLIHHIVVKANLFFAASYIERISGSVDLSKLGNLLRKERLFSVMFVLSALSLVGIPPLSGFWAKVYTLVSTLKEESYLAAFLVLLVSLMTLLSMLKIWAGVFWKPHQNPYQILPKKRARWLFVPLVILNLWTLAIGTQASVVWGLVESMAQEVMPNVENNKETVADL